MCRVGVRCAGHTESRLQTKNAKLNKKYDALAKAEFDYANASTDRQKKACQKQAQNIKTSIQEMNVEIGHIQREYDGTPTGQEKLNEALLTADSVQRTVLMNRKIKGSIARDWLKRNAKAQARKKAGGEKLYRNNVIFLGGAPDRSMFDDELKTA